MEEVLTVRIKNGTRKTYKVGSFFDRKCLTHAHASFTGLIRVREGLMSQLKELNKQKPRMKTDENLLAEIARLESTLRVQRDDLVCLT